MAYLQDFKDDELKKDENGQQSLTSDNTVNSSPATNSNEPKPNVSTGSGYVNLDKYVTANTGRSEELGRQVADPISKNVASEVSSRENVLNSAKSAANNNTVTDQGIIDRIKNSPSSLSDKRSIDQYNKQAAGYAGPQSAVELGGYQDLSSIQSKNQNTLGLLNSQSGLQSILGDQFGKDRQYTAGSKTLDAALIGSGNAAKPLQDIKSQYSSLQPMSGFEDNISKLLGSAKSTTDKTATDTKQALQDRLGGYSSQYGNLLAQLNQESNTANDRYNALSSGLSNDSKDAWKDVGLNDYGVGALKKGSFDLSSLVSGPKTRSLGDVAGDTSGYSALTNLAGMPSQFDFSKTGNTAVASPTINTNSVQSANKLGELIHGIEAKLNNQNTQRSKEYKAASAAATANPGLLSESQINNNAALFGLSPDQYVKARSTGALSGENLKQGAQLNFGDLIGESAPIYDQLVQQLGLSNMVSSKDTQDEGAAFNLNKQSILDALNRVQTRSTPMLPAKLGQLAIPGVGYELPVQNPGEAKPVKPKLAPIDSETDKILKQFTGR